MASGRRLEVVGEAQAFDIGNIRDVHLQALEVQFQWLQLLAVADYVEEQIITVCLAFDGQLAEASQVSRDRLNIQQFEVFMLWSDRQLFNARIGFGECVPVDVPLGAKAQRLQSMELKIV